MIQVIIKKEKNDIQKISLNGHSGYEVSGKDIVCASASSILITSVNAILRYQKDAILVKQEDTDTIHVTVTVLKHDKMIDLLLENLVALLTELASDYPKNIKINRK